MNDARGECSMGEGETSNFSLRARDNMGRNNDGDAKDMKLYF